MVKKYRILDTSEYLIWQVAVAVISSIICLIMQICAAPKKVM